MKKIEQTPPEPTEGLPEALKSFKWGEDYGKDLLIDINQLAHAAGTGALYRDVLQRAYKEIFRARAMPLQDGSKK